MAYYLRKCVWEITLACCFSCKYCGSAGGQARENELTTAECISVAGQLADLGCKKVTLIGGEIFLRPDWSTITRALTDRDICVAVITNGYLFTDEIIRQLQDVKVSAVCVSIDGPEAVNDYYRQVGSFQRAKQAIITLSEHSIPVAVISTLNSENIHQLDYLYKEMRDLPLYCWQLQACTPMGNAETHGIEYEFDHRLAIDFVVQHIDDAPFRIGIADNIGYFTHDEGRLRGNPSGLAIFHGCQAGISSIGIDSVGNVRGCESQYADAFIEGNLRQQSLISIWEAPNAFSYNRNFSTSILTGYCSNCFYGSICAGGCRSYNYFVHRKLFEAPFCARNMHKE